MTPDGPNRRAFLAATAAGATGIGLRRVALGGSAARQSAAGLLVFAYDDGPAEDYTQAYERAHQPEGVPGCSGVPSARVGDDGGGRWLSHDRIREMASDGWEIMSHSVIHRALAPIPLRQDAAPGDTKLYAKYDFHGKQPGDTIEITDGSTSEVATVAGRGEDDRRGKRWRQRRRPVVRPRELQVAERESAPDRLVETAGRLDEHADDESHVHHVADEHAHRDRRADHATHFDRDRRTARLRLARVHGRARGRSRLRAQAGDRRRGGGVRRGTPIAGHLPDHGVAGRPVERATARSIIPRCLAPRGPQPGAR